MTGEPWTGRRHTHGVRSPRRSSTALRRFLQRGQNDRVETGERSAAPAWLASPGTQAGLNRKGPVDRGCMPVRPSTVSTFGHGVAMLPYSALSEKRDTDRMSSRRSARPLLPVVGRRRVCPDAAATRRLRRPPAAATSAGAPYRRPRPGRRIAGVRPAWRPVRAGSAALPSSGDRRPHLLDDGFGRTTSNSEPAPRHGAAP